MSGTRASRGRAGRKGRLGIVLAYALVSVAWIAFSDRVVEALAADPALRVAINTGKGVAFVLVTASLIWLLLLARDLRLDRGRQELAESEERYRMLAERAQDVVYRLRLAPTPAFDYVSPAIEALTGHTPAEHYADPSLVRDLIHPDDRQLLAEAAIEGFDGPVLVRWLQPDGGIRWTEHRVTPVRDAEGRTVAVEGAARDVTARILADADRLVLMQAIDRSPVGVALVGGPATGFEMTYLNPALCELIGMDRDALVGRSAFGFADVGGPSLQDGTVDRIAGGEPFELEYTMPRPGGDGIPARLLVSPLLGKGDEVEGVLVFLQDRSEAAARSRAEAILRASMDSSPLAVVTMDLDGVVLGWNGAAERLFGWTAQETIGSRVPYLDEAGWEGTADRRHRLVEGTAEPSVVRPFRIASGGHVMCHLTTGVIRDAAGQPMGFVSLINDLTDALRREEWNNQLRRAIDFAAEAVVITDLAGTITYVNPAFESVSGYAASELLGRNPRVLKSGLVPPVVYEDMWQRLSAGETWRGMLVNRRKDGSLYEEEATFSAVLGADGRPTAYVGVKRDLTLERRLAAGLNTELRDRAAVEEAMARIEVRETAEATAQGVCDALAAFGDVGDVELVYLPPGRGLVVPIACAPATMPIRLGQPLEPRIAAYIRERAVGGSWSDNHREGHVDARIDVPEFEGTVRVAAPIRHRGRTVAALMASTQSSSPDAWIARHLKIVSELATHAGALLGPQLETHDLGSASEDEVRRVIDQGAFSPVFQPVCDLASRQPIGWEAFSRFADGTAPIQRFADARAVGLGDALEIAAGQKAVEAFGALGASGWLSVNVSPSLLLSGAAGRIVALAGRPIVLELTEQVHLDDYARLRGAIDLLEPPAMLAVDDGGAGYASLRDVLDLRPDFVKLDPGVVHEIDRNDTRQAMVAGMVHYATENGSRLIAEGIETEAERRTLLRLGVRYGQGYLLGVPSADGAVAPRRHAAPPRRLRAVGDEPDGYTNPAAG